MEKYAPGVQAKLCGLKSEPSLNGQNCVSLGQIPSTGRVQVRLSSGRELAVRDHCLNPSCAAGALSTGSRVVLTGLHQAPELSGREATIIGIDVASGRYRVDVDGNVIGVESLKAEHLVLLPMHEPKNETAADIMQAPSEAVDVDHEVGTTCSAFPLGDGVKRKVKQDTIIDAEFISLGGSTLLVEGINVGPQEKLPPHIKLSAKWHVTQLRGPATVSDVLALAQNHFSSNGQHPALVPPLLQLVNVSPEAENPGRIWPANDEFLPHYMACGPGMAQITLQEGQAIWVVKPQHDQEMTDPDTPWFPEKTHKHIPAQLRKYGSTSGRRVLWSCQLEAENDWFFSPSLQYLFVWADHMKLLCHSAVTGEAEVLHSSLALGVSMDGEKVSPSLEWTHVSPDGNFVYMGFLGSDQDDECVKRLFKFQLFEGGYSHVGSAKAENSFSSLSDLLNLAQWSCNLSYLSEDEYQGSFPGAPAFFVNEGKDIVVFKAQYEIAIYNVATDHLLKVFNVLLDFETQDVFDHDELEAKMETLQDPDHGTSVFESVSRCSKFLKIVPDEGQESLIADGSQVVELVLDFRRVHSAENEQAAYDELDLWIHTEDGKQIAARMRGSDDGMLQDCLPTDIAYVDLRPLKYAALPWPGTKVVTLDSFPDVKKDLELQDGESQYGYWPYQPKTEALVFDRV